MENDIIQRIRRQSPLKDIFDVMLEDISFSDLQSLLLGVYQRKVKGLECKAVLRQYEKNRFVKPSGTSPIRLNEIDSVAFSSISPDCEILDLSPVSPLGCCSAMGSVNQNNIITTIRNTEVCSDLTNVLALECAVRRRELLKKDGNSIEQIKLCSSHRVIRAQPIDNPNSFAHFKLIGMCTAGRDEGNMQFEMKIAYEHLHFYLVLISKLIKLDYRFKSINIELIAYKLSCDEILKRIRNLLTNQPYPIPVTISIIERCNQNYYTNMGFHLYGINSSDEELFLVDGGLTDWTQKLLNNKKERLMISGIGTERLVHCFS